MTNLMSIKRGDTFVFTATMTDSEGLPIENQVSNFKCEIRNGDHALIADLLVEETTVLGTYKFTTPSTDDWLPLTTLYTDIQYTVDGITSSSNTMSIAVLRDVTQ